MLIVIEAVLTVGNFKIGIDRDQKSYFCFNVLKWRVFNRICIKDIFNLIVKFLSKIINYITFTLFLKTILVKLF